MLYWFVRPLAQLAFLVYFRKIFVHGIGHIPRDKPVIFAANHPSAFMEACLLACFQPSSLHFLVRGDVFVNPVVRWILGQLHQIPIYRFRDGFGKLRGNFDSFEKCYEWLLRKKNVLVFVEANTKWEIHLHPAQKGLARIAFGASDRGAKDIHIVPVGINYECPFKTRTEVNISFGEAIRLDDFLHLKDERERLRTLTSEIETHLKQQVVHLDNVEQMSLFDDVKRLCHRPARPWPILVHDRSRFEAEKKMAKTINGMDAAELQAIEKQIGTIRQSSQERLPAPPEKFSWSRWSRAIHVVVFPVLRIVNWLMSPPYLISRGIAEGKVRKIEFQGPVLIGLAMFLYLFYFVIIAVVIALVLGWKYLWIPFVLFFLGYMSVLSREKHRYWRRKSAIDKLPQEDRRSLETATSAVRAAMRADQVNS